MPSPVTLSLTASTILILAACAGESECEETAKACDGDILQECADGAHVY